MTKTTITCDLDVTASCLNELKKLSDELNGLDLKPLNMTSTGSTSTEIQHTWQLLIDYKAVLLKLINESYTFTDTVYKNFAEADQKSSVSSGKSSDDRIVGDNDTVKPDSSPQPTTSPNPTTSGKDLNVPQRQWIHTTPQYVSDETNRSADNYCRVLEQFDVTHSNRYTRNVMDGQSKSGVTWCNIYAWDVTEAMGAEIPHWYNPNTGEPMAVGASGAYEMGTGRMNTWMDQFGAKYGWRQMTAAEAQQAANAGKPTIALSSGHIAMVSPSQPGYDPGPNGPIITQAGARNFEYGTTRSGFGSEYSQVRYFTHD